MEAILKKKKKRKFKIVGIIFSIIIVLLLAVFITLKMTFLKSFPELTGDPEIGKWYRVTPEGTKSSDGSEWHGIFRKGTENKVVVYFFGGGVSINDETSKGGKEFFVSYLQFPCQVHLCHIVFFSYGCDKCAKLFCVHNANLLLFVRL